MQKNYMLQKLQKGVGEKRERIIGRQRLETKVLIKAGQIGSNGKRESEHYLPYGAVP